MNDLENYINTDSSFVDGMDSVTSIIGYNPKSVALWFCEDHIGDDQDSVNNAMKMSHTSLIKWIAVEHPCDISDKQIKTNAKWACTFWSEVVNLLDYDIKTFESNINTCNGKLYLNSTIPLEYIPEKVAKCVFDNLKSDDHKILLNIMNRVKSEHHIIFSKFLPDSDHLKWANYYYNELTLRIQNKLNEFNAFESYVNEINEQNGEEMNNIQKDHPEIEVHMGSCGRIEDMKDQLNKCQKLISRVYGVLTVMNIFSPKVIECINKSLDCNSLDESINHINDYVKCYYQKELTEDFKEVYSDLYNYSNDVSSTNTDLFEQLEEECLNNLDLKITRALMDSFIHQEYSGLEVGEKACDFYKEWAVDMYPEMLATFSKRAGYFSVVKTNPNSPKGKGVTFLYEYYTVLSQYFMKKLQGLMESQNNKKLVSTPEEIINYYLNNNKLDAGFFYLKDNETAEIIGIEVYNKCKDENYYTKLKSFVHYKSKEVTFKENKTKEEELLLRMCFGFLTSTFSGNE